MKLVEINVVDFFYILIAFYHYYYRYFLDYEIRKIDTKKFFKMNAKGHKKAAVRPKGGQKTSSPRNVVMNYEDQPGETYNVVMDTDQDTGIFRNLTEQQQGTSKFLNMAVRTEPQKQGMSVINLKHKLPETQIQDFIPNLTSLVYPVISQTVVIGNVDIRERVKCTHSKHLNVLVPHLLMHPYIDLVSTC